jgi:hypothetical protein
LLLFYKYLDFSMFCSDNFEKIFREHFCACNLTFIWSSVAESVE